MNVFAFFPSLPSLFLTCLLQVTLLSIIVALLYLVAGRFNANVGAVTAIAGLVGVLLLTLMAASPWPHWEPSRLLSQNRPSIPTTEIAAPAENESLVASPVVPPETTAQTIELESESPLLAAWKAVGESLRAVSSEPVQNDVGKATSLSWKAMIPLLLILGVAFFLLRMMLALFSVNKLVKTSVAIDDSELHSQFESFKQQLSVSKSVALRQSAQVPTPATVGWWNPTILLPEGWTVWSKPETDAVLAHELAHVASGDYLSWVIARFTVAFHFYHPVVRWLADRLQLEQELAADEVAANLLGNRKKYLHSLASLALGTPVHQMAGPARTLIPQQSLLTKRVEMLRTSKPRGASKAPFVRLTAFAMTAIAAIAIAGFFKPVIGQQTNGKALAASNVVAVTAPDTAKVERIPLTLVPESSLGVVSVRPKELLSRDAFRGLVEPISQEQNIKAALEMFGASVDDVQEVMFVSGRDSSLRVVVQFATPEKCQRAIEGALKNGNVSEMKKSNINGLVTWRDDVDKPRSQLTKLDELTIVLDSRPGNDSEFPAIAEIENSLPTWAEEWLQLKDRQLVAAVQLDQALKTKMLEAGGGFFLSGGFPLQAGSPLIQNTRWAVTGIGLRDQAELDLVAECDSLEGAEKVARTIQALMLLASNVVGEQEAAMLANIAQSAEPKEVALKPAVKSAFKFASEFLNKAEPKVDGQRVQLAFTYPIDEAELAIMTSVLRPVMTSAQASAFQARSSNNMRQLLLGCHNHADRHGHFPPASNYEYVDDTGQTKRSKHPHSWRIDMLPWIGQEELWKLYRFEEPWDSDANKRLLGLMPEAFRHPMDRQDSSNTSYFAITGPETVFAGEAGAKFIDIRDGLSNTILLVEAKRSVPWTKPEDISYAQDRPLEKMGGWFDGLFVAGFADGHISVFTEPVDETTLRAMFTKNGGERMNQ